MLVGSKCTILGFSWRYHFNYTSRCTTTSGNVCWNGFDQNLRIWTVKCSWTRFELGQLLCWPGSQTGKIYISAWILRRLSAQFYGYTRVFEVGEFQYCLMQAYIRNTPECLGSYDIYSKKLPTATPHVFSFSGGIAMKYQFNQYNFVWEPPVILNFWLPFALPTIHNNPIEFLEFENMWGAVGSSLL